jgi:hypothetical protein
MAFSFSADGGFANLSRAIEVHDDGSAEVVRGTARTASRPDQATIAAIVAKLDASALFDRDREFAAVPGADLQRYTITYRGYTVVAFDTVVPPALVDAIVGIERIIRLRT